MQNESTFSINAKTCTLISNSQDNGGTILGNNVKYIIPIYQRPYSWTSDQIKKFISDIFNSFWDKDGIVQNEPMFIGTMQLSTINKNNEQEIIDGQQRLTTFLLLIKVLKIRFEKCETLEAVSLNWLFTKVNSGKQQEYLLEVLESNSFLRKKTLNPYLNNTFLIDELVIQEIATKVGNFSEFEIFDFVNFLTSNVYFVVIETKAGLSKTLQIFNSINTTGLDLNGGDIFKIRMYEYLKDIKKKDESAFEEISSLYKKIDDYNHNLGYNYIYINEVLSIYQYSLIAKYSLPVILYSMASDTFYERLFDTIFNINQWEHFKMNAKNIDMSLDELNRIVESMFEWENCNYFSGEDACAVNFIWESRYSKYWSLAFLFIYKFKDLNDYWDKLLYFIRQISKLFIIYTIRFQKIKSDIYYGFMYKVIDAIVNKSYEEVIGLINMQIGEEKNHIEWYDINWFITENLIENTKRKNIVCKLSSMLHEDFRTKDQTEIDLIRRKLFEQEIDIEHIQSVHHDDENKRTITWNKWGKEINSLGNLIVLERKINRSISNKTYSFKLKNGYSNSEYKIVKSLSVNFGKWDLEECIERKELERKKIVEYLFSK